jgi:general secretion pathway protein G
MVSRAWQTRRSLDAQARSRIGSKRGPRRALAAQSEATRTKHGSRLTAGAFTLIELIIVLAILALLLTIAVPRYFAHIERAKEATLKQDLAVMRDAIDKFHGDKGRYPESLEELVTLRYIRSVPVDPITDSESTWKVVPPSDSEAKGAVYDVKSGAEGNRQDGKPFADL